MASSENEDYDYSDDDYDCSDSEYDDGAYVSEEDDPVDRAGEPSPYVLEMEDAVRQRQDAAVKETTDLLAVSRGFAAALLRRCQWDAEQLRNEWFADNNGRRMCEAAGLPPADGGGFFVPTVVNDAELTCAICFDAFGPGEMRSAWCAAHFYCQECWRGYIRAAVGDGPRCLSLRCPNPGCTAAVVRELVDDVAEEEDRTRYATFFVRSFVEEGKNKHVRWCPGAGCTRAVRSNIGLGLYEVLCACAHGFCFRCGEEAHRPATCETARAWTAKDSSDGETMNWVLANTKHCPKCRRAIEKNQGCMHMTCSDPCRHQFCWLCLGPWADHTGYYTCNRYESDKADGKLSEDEQRQSQAKASLERYLHFYERFKAYGDSRKKARADLDGLNAGGLDEFAKALGVPTDKQVDVLPEAYEQVIDCRRVLQWIYPYVYYLDEERDAVKLQVIDLIQSRAQDALETLHRCAEKERRDLVFEAAAAAYDLKKRNDMFKAYREKLVHLTEGMRYQFNNLIKGFEDGFAEIVGS